MDDMVAELWLFFYRHAQQLNCAHVSLLAKVPLLSASISTAAGNSHKLAYFELSKASVAVGLYKASYKLLLGKWACPSKSH